MKRRGYLLIVACVFAVLFAGCGESSDGGVSGGEDGGSGGGAAEGSVVSGYQYDQDRMQQLVSCSHAAISEMGYYYIVNDILYYFDVESFLNTPMCSRVECRHKGKDCDAFVTTVDPTSSDLSCNCLGYKLFVYEGYLYFIERTDVEFILYRTDSSFNQLEKVAVLASMQEERRIVVSADAALIVNGYLYYYSSVYDEKYAEKDYMQTFQCMRIRLEKDAVPETVGEFDFPGDYAMAAGDPCGLRILRHEDRIYFVAGGTDRWYTKKDPIQSRLSVYDTSTGEFQMLLSSAGYKRTDAWGEGTGRLAFIEDTVCIDDKGRIYVLTGRELGAPDEPANIVRIIPETGQAEIIYTTKQDGMRQLLCDGVYLYFLEGDIDVQEGEAPGWITAVDADGNLVSRLELKYDEKYLENYAESRKNAPENDRISMTRALGNVILYLVDDRYLMIAAREDAFQNLTSEKIFQYYGTVKDFHEKMTYGVGILEKDRFLEGENCEILPIYQLRK